MIATSEYPGRTSLDSILRQFGPQTNALYHHPSIGMIIINPQGAYDIVNPVAARLLGATPAQLLGRKHTDVFTDQCHWDAFRQVAACRWVCYSIHRPPAHAGHGAPTCWDISLTLRQRHSGQPIGYLMLIQEASPLMQALQEAEQHRLLFATLLENVPAGIIVTQGRQGRVVVMNAIARDLCGGKIDIGSEVAHIDLRGVRDIHGRPVTLSQNPLVRAALYGEHADGVTLTCPRPDGRLTTLLVDCAPLTIWGGEPAAIATLRDITAQADYDRQLEEKNRQLEDLDHAKDAFLANLSHELKTPLTAILGWAGVGRDAKDAALKDRALEVVERNAQRQMYMTEDLLTLTACLAGRLELCNTTVNLRACCEAAIAQAHIVASGETPRIDLRISPHLECVADPARLQQLLEKLFSNACKFSTPEGLVTVTAEADGDWVVMQITDTGVGFRTEEGQLLFQPFWQADASASRKYPGLGIGLFLVKELVALHGGTVSVESDGQNCGARVRVCLPRRGPAQPA